MFIYMYIHTYVYRGFRALGKASWQRPLPRKLMSVKLLTSVCGCDMAGLQLYKVSSQETTAKAK